MMQRESKSQGDYAAFVGVDWGDQRHAVCVLLPGQEEAEAFSLEHQPEEIAAWAEGLRQRFDQAIQGGIQKSPKGGRNLEVTCDRAVYQVETPSREHQEAREQ